MGSIPQRQAVAEITRVPDSGGGADGILTPFYPPTDSVSFSSGQDLIPINNNPVELDVEIPATVSTMYLLQFMFLIAVGGGPGTGGVGAFLGLAVCYRDSAGVLQAPAVIGSPVQVQGGDTSLVAISASLQAGNTLRVSCESTNVGNNQIGFRYTLHEQPIGFDLPTPPGG